MQHALRRPFGNTKFFDDVVQRNAEMARRRHCRQFQQLLGLVEGHVSRLE